MLERSREQAGRDGKENRERDLARHEPRGEPVVRGSRAGEMRGIGSTPRPAESPAALSAGSNPNAIPVVTARIAVKANTPPPKRISAVRGMFGGSEATIHRAPAIASRKPSVAPTSATITLSVSSWRTSRPRPPPSADRTVNSRSRAVTRASMRLARLTHATSSTTPTHANSSRSAGRSLPTRLCWSEARDDPLSVVLAGIPQRVQAAEAGENRGQRRPRALGRHARCQARDPAAVAHGPRFSRAALVDGERRPEARVRRGKRERRRHHAGDERLDAVDEHVSPDDARIAAVAIDPQRMREEDHVSRARPARLGAERAADLRCDAEQRDEVRRDREALESHCLAIVAVGDAPRTNHRHIGESRAGDCCSANNSPIDPTMLASIVTSSCGRLYGSGEISSASRRRRSWRWRRWRPPSLRSPSPRNRARGATNAARSARPVEGRRAIRSGATMHGD